MYVQSVPHCITCFRGSMSGRGVLGDRVPDPLSAPEFGGSAREGGAGKKQEKTVHPWPLIGSLQWAENVRLVTLCLECSKKMCLLLVLYT